jgi:hypothetical protein
VIGPTVAVPPIACTLKTQMKLVFAAAVASEPATAPVVDLDKQISVEQRPLDGLPNTRVANPLFQLRIKRPITRYVQRKLRLSMAARSDNNAKPIRPSIRAIEIRVRCIQSPGERVKFLRQSQSFASPLDQLCGFPDVTRRVMLRIADFAVPKGFHRSARHRFFRCPKHSFHRARHAREPAPACVS